MEKFENAFILLDKKLKESNLNAKMITVGGFVMAQNDLRTTRDIDAFMPMSTSNEINRLIYEVGEELKLNQNDELWLNNSVASLNRTPPEEICDVVFKSDNLTVLKAPLIYVLGMKCESARNRDIKDIGLIIKKLNKEDPVKVLNELKRLGFAKVDLSDILEGFANAYGFEWLEQYYRENEKIVRENI